MFHYEIASSLNAGHDVLARVMEEARHRGYDEHRLFGIRLALEEALVNAIRHGNKLDPTKKVRVDVSINSRRIEISVEDEGIGFQRAGVPDPRSDANIERCCGRGLLLMESYMDRVEYSLGGRRIRMMKLRRKGGGATGKEN